MILIKDYKTLLSYIEKAKEENVKPVKYIMRKTNVSYKTAKTLFDFASSIATKDDAEKEDEVKRELQFYSDEIARIKSYYLNNGFHLNEKGEKIPTMKTNHGMAKKFTYIN